MHSRFQISQNIMKCRQEGNLEKAVEEANRGITLFQNDNFFYKIKGDLLLEQRMFSEAADAYTMFLEHLDENKMHFFRHFVKFWKAYAQNVDFNEIKKRYQFIKDKADSGNYEMLICRELVRLFRREKIETETPFYYLLEEDNKYVAQWIKGNEKARHHWVVFLFLFWVDERIVRNEKILSKNSCIVRNMLYVVSVMERYELYPEAIRLVTWVLERSSDEVAIRSLFRLCRKIGDYEAADEYLNVHPGIVDKAQFNIQYELFYYYLSLNDEDNLKKTLKYLRDSASSSVPISRTLQNFYIQLGRLDDAQDMQDNISSIRGKSQTASKAKGEAEAIEAAEGTLYAYKSIMSEQEHTRQLIAIKELLKGFSHELGQPITNIRYGIQLYQMKMQRHMDSAEALRSLLENILKQTERLHRLLKLFSPVVEGKNKNQIFNCITNIYQAFEDMHSRLEKIGICYDIQGVENFYIYGDPVKFDQVFYNLIINSADELKNVIGKKKISVNCSIENNQLHISFRDNGSGIPKEIARKIFHPFFSTKSTNTPDSGTGLGLYIVWNILKMYGGSIYVNLNYIGGAEFIITLPKGEINHV